MLILQMESNQKKRNPTILKGKAEKKSNDQVFQVSISNVSVGSEIPIMASWVLKHPSNLI